MGDAPDNLGSVQIGALLFKDTNLGVWKYGSKWVATKELKKLLGDEASHSSVHQATTISSCAKATT